jgi:hypothetical protein
MVSPNDHVVMNHQNQTRTNGIWGHVRYKHWTAPATIFFIFRSPFYTCVTTPLRGAKRSTTPPPTSPTVSPSPSPAGASRHNYGLPLVKTKLSCLNLKPHDAGAPLATWLAKAPPSVRLVKFRLPPSFAAPGDEAPRQHVRGMSPPPKLLCVSSPCLYIISFIPSTSQCLLSPWSISSGRDTRLNFWEVVVRLKLAAAIRDGFGCLEIRIICIRIR